jgi:lysozyme family protein
MTGASSSFSPLFRRALNETVGVEGGYSSHPLDRGGATRFGITESVARAYGYVGEMRELPFSRAAEIYFAGWWQLMRCEEIGVSSAEVALEVFDTGVNCGQAVSVRFLQRALNQFNRQGRDYPDVTVDGLMGRVTLVALHKYLITRGKKGELVLLKALNCQQGTYYFGVTDTRPANEEFVYGWFLNRVRIGHA